MEVVKAMESLKVIPQCGYVKSIATFSYNHIRGIMKQERLNLYRIEMKYIRNLHNVDNRVSSVSPQIGKQHRIYVGIVVVCNKRKYLIPLSHPVDKHKKMKSRADFDKIIDKRGKLLGVLNYNLMIPVEEHLLIKVDLKKGGRDSVKTEHYKQLCIDELSWCRKNAETIINKANCLYRFCTENTNYKGKSRCLDFKRLELECEKYIAKIRESEE